MIFQEPMTALSPTRRVGDQMADLLIAHQGLSRADALTHAAGLLERVQIRNPRQVLRDYPFQLSGGMRQRVLIAMAFAGRPRLVIADEITTAIDATVGRAVLDLLADWARDIDAAILFISHDLALVGRFCQRVVVMQAGRIVEEGPADRVIQSPQHPYTRLLRAALPELGKPGHPLLASIEPLS
jgi:peptide/nickel transport system ATP-binding protein